MAKLALELIRICPTFTLTGGVVATTLVIASQLTECRCKNSIIARHDSPTADAFYQPCQVFNYTIYSHRNFLSTKNGCQIAVHFLRFLRGTKEGKGHTSGFKAYLESRKSTFFIIRHTVFLFPTLNVVRGP